MSSVSDIPPYIRYSVLSGLEQRVVNVVCYQFAQYEGQDWQTLTAALGQSTTDLAEGKVRMSEHEIYSLDQNCESLHQKMHIAINTFVFKAKMDGLEIHLIEHVMEVLSSNLPFRTPARILIESILHEKLKH